MGIFLSSTNVLIVMWAALAILLLIFVARTDLKLSKKMLIVPLTFLLLYVTINDTIKLLGYPYDGYPEGEFQIIGHRTETVDGNKHIIMWLRNKDGDRLHRFPYNKEIKRVLRGAAKEAKKGVKQVGKFSKFGYLQVYDFPYQKRIPKNHGLNQ